jgi:hypothetical protein
MSGDSARMTTYGVRPLDLDYLKAVEGTSSEWGSAEYEAAYRETHGRSRREPGGRDEDQGPFGAVAIAASSPRSRSRGAGGQPGIFTSTGMTFATAPQLA